MSLYFKYINIDQVTFIRIAEKRVLHETLAMFLTIYSKKFHTKTI